MYNRIFIFACLISTTLAGPKAAELTGMESEQQTLDCKSTGVCRVQKQTIACSMAKSEEILRSDVGNRFDLIKENISNSNCDIVTINKIIQVDKTNNSRIVYASENSKHVGYIPLGVPFVEKTDSPLELLSALYQTHLTLKACHEQGIGDISDEEYAQIADVTRTLQDRLFAQNPNLSQTDKDRAWEASAAGYQEITAIFKSVQGLNGITAGGTASNPQIMQVCDQLAAKWLSDKGPRKLSRNKPDVPHKDF